VDHWSAPVVFHGAAAVPSRHQPTNAPVNTCVHSLDGPTLRRHSSPPPAGIDWTTGQPLWSSMVQLRGSVPLFCPCAHTATPTTIQTLTSTYKITTNTWHSNKHCNHPPSPPPAGIDWTIGQPLWSSMVQLQLLRSATLHTLLHPTKSCICTQTHIVRSIPLSFRRY
jgi:hypothetical protein